MKWGRPFICLIVCWLALAGLAHSSTIMSNIDTMGTRIREATGLHNTSVLPDSTLWDICKRAVIFTSVVAGGVESQVRITTSGSQGFYAMPDSVVRILFATYITDDGATKELRAWYPQYGIEPDELESGDPDNVPGHYNWWNDTVQFLPIPQNADDTAIFKVYVEHSDYSDSTDNDVPIDLETPYKELAFDYACYKVLLVADMPEKAAIFKAVYDQNKQEIMQTYARQFEQDYPHKK